jgi:acetolactate synthase-1/2/3 large subunit
MKLSDYVAEKVVELGTKHVFMVTGGGAMHLNHSFGTNKNLECIFNHHEQACAIAAEAYYRLNNQLPVVNVTSGPGGTNAITGVYGAFVDSVGMVILSGQVKWETTVRSTGMKLRQYGDQELDIEDLVRPVTKYVAMITDPKLIRYHIEKAYYLARNGRPGPCWLDIPLNIQGAQIDPNDLIGFDPLELNETWEDIEKINIAKITDCIENAKRPVILAGSGVRLSGKHESFIQIVNNLKIPIVTAWNAHDAIWDDHPYYIGRPGTVGDRAGNFAVQNADLLLILGSRLNIRQVSYNWNSFAREAYKIWVDIDDLELKKPTVKAEMPIHADLSDFLPALAIATEDVKTNLNHVEWREWCLERKKRYPVVLKEYWDNPRINPYCFIQKLFEKLPENQKVVAGNGSACVVGFQAATLKPGQRFWTNSGCATMGYDLPAAIGIYKASGGEDVICLAGDGSIMMNLQELQTIAGNKMPIKIFVINNSGYVSIFQTHRNFFNGVEVGGGPKSGVTFPSFEKLSAAFDIPYFKAENHNQLNEILESALGLKGPVICEIIVDENISFAPKLGAKQHADGRITSPPLEDLSPFLSRDELLSNMIIDSPESE